MPPGPREVLVVTGHTRGLGAALVAEGIAHGLVVVGVGRSPHPGLGARDAAEVIVDLADPAAAAGAVEHVLAIPAVSSADRIHLVANAGVLQPVRRVGALGAAEVAHAVSVNLTAPIVMADALVRATSAHDLERRIALVSSGAGRNPYVGWSVYCATKAGLDHFARTLAAEAPPRCRVESIAPGVIDTDMQAEIRAADPEHFPQRPRFEAMAAGGSLVAPGIVAARLLAHLRADTFGATPVTDLREL